MAQGQTRREVAKDSLAGMAEIKPVRLSGGGVSAPQTQQAAPLSAVTQVLNSLGDWALEGLKEQSNVRHEKATMDGAMSAVQGKTLEQIELDGGDKWALQGHRIMTANTISAGMIAAQKQKIEETDFALDADAYRAQYVAQLGAAVEGQDPRTTAMIQQQMLEQMPDLVARQTVANVSYMEQQNYDAVAQGIDAWSQDTNGINNFLSFTQGGEGSASGGLSDARRNAAITEGVQFAFLNDNALAYGILKATGGFDNFSLDEMTRIEAARTGWMNKRRRTFDQTMFDGLEAIDAQTADGTLTGYEAAEATAAVLAKNGIEITGETYGRAYSAADTSSKVRGRANAKLFQAAALRGDVPAMAALTLKYVIGAESSGDMNAVGPTVLHGANAGDNAISDMQTMAKTRADPGYGVKPAADNSLAEAHRVGVDYWTAMMGGTLTGGGINWQPGDVEAAAIAYNAGPENAKAWINAGRDYSVLPQRATTEKYAKGILKDMAADKTPTGAEFYNDSVALLASAKETFELDAYAAAEPRIAESGQRFSTGSLTYVDWQAELAVIYTETNAIRGKSQIAREVSRVNTLVTAIRKQSGETLDAEQSEQAVILLLGAQSEFEAVVNDETKSMEDKAAAMAKMVESREAVYTGLGIMPKDQGNAAAIKKMADMVRSAQPARRTWLEGEVEIDRAVTDGTVAYLNKPLQKRAIQRGLDSIIKSRGDQLNESGGGEEAEAVHQGESAEDLIQLWSNMNYVDPKTVQMDSSLINRMVDDDGNALPDAVDALGRYARMLEVNPRLADTYLDNDARIDANAVLARAGTLGLLAENMQEYKRQLKPVTAKEARDFVNVDANQVLIREAADAWVETRDVGFMQAIYRSSADLSDTTKLLNSERTQLRSEETLDRVSAVLQAEVRRLHLKRPDVPIQDLVATASQNISRTTATFAGNVVSVKFDIKEKMWPGQVHLYDKDGVENDVMLLWLQSDAMQAAHPGLSTVNWTELLPEGVQDLISGALFGEGPDFNRSFSRRDANNVLARNVRPYEAHSTADGKNIFAQYMQDDGTASPPIPYDIAAAGHYYADVQNEVGRHSHDDE